MHIRFRNPKISSPDTITSPVLISKEAARYLNVSHATLQKMVKKRWVIPSQTPGGHHRYTIDQLNEALNNSRTSKTQ
jgi:excisionase family DNA binding protein